MNLLPVYTTLTYERVAPLLGFTVLTAHPKSAECPYCGNRTWSVYLESLTMEEWCHCRHCKRAGNIIATAAAHLRMPEYDTLLYLASKLKIQFTAATLQTYRRKLIRDSNTEQLWRMCQAQSIRPSQPHRLFLRSLNCLPSDKISAEQLSNGLSHLFGVVEQRQVHKYRDSRDLLPATVLEVGQRRQSYREIPSTMLCIPLYGTPSRIDSLATISAERELSLHSQGLAGLPLLGQFDDSRIVMTSTMLPMLQMQVQHAGHSLAPLPMLGWKQERLTLGYMGWPVLAGHELTFWDPEPTGLMLYMAKSTNARISFFGRKSAKLPRLEWISRWTQLLRTTPAIDVLAKIRQQSMSVEDAVRSWADTATPQQLAGLLQSVEYVDSETADMVYRIIDPHGTRYRARQFRVTSYAARGHEFAVSERNGKLYGSSNRVRLPGKLRVTHIVMEDRRIAEYIGYLQTEDRKIPFRCERTSATGEWMRNFCLQHQIYIESLNYMRTTEAVNPRRLDNLDFFRVAMAISPPSVVIRRKHIGWDGENYSFQHLTITPAGIVPTPLYEHAVGSPGPQQTLSQQWMSLPKNTLAITPELTAAWSMIIALAAQLTAEPAGLPVTAVQVSESDPIRTWFVNRLLKRLTVTCDETQRRHKWPACVTLSSFYSPAAKRTAYAVAITKDLKAETILVKLPQVPLLGVNLPLSLCRVLPAYLTFIMTRHHIPELSAWQDLLTYTTEALCLLADDPDGAKQIRNAARNVTLVDIQGRLQQPVVHDNFIQ
jgi:hypothetical protein